MTKIVNNKKFDSEKDKYCPICYFENNKLILREECLHNAVVPMELEDD